MPPTISAREAARELGVSVRTVQRWADSGKLPPERRVPGGHGYLEFSRRQVETLARRLARAAAERRMVL